MEATKLLKSTLAVTLLASSTAFAAGVTSGQLVIINKLANDTSGAVGVTASPVSVVVSDAMGVCSTTERLAYNGVVVVPWDAAKPHGASSCNKITNVAVTPLPSMIGATETIIYNNTNIGLTLPLTTATATNYSAPTSAHENLVLIITGNGKPMPTARAAATSWGMGTNAFEFNPSDPALPKFAPENGMLADVGVPGGNGTYGEKAEMIMAQLHITPHHSAK